MAEKTDPRSILNPIKLNLENVALTRSPRKSNSTDSRVKLSDAVKSALAGVPKCNDAKAVDQAVRAWLERELAGKAVQEVVLAGAYSAAKRAFTATVREVKVIVVGSGPAMADVWGRCAATSAERSKRIKAHHAAKVSGSTGPVATTPAKKKGSK